MSRYQLFVNMFITVICLGLTQVSNAALISVLQDPTPTEAEVQNQGILAAVNLGENQSNTSPGYAAAVSVNGVNFDPLTTALPGNATSTSINESFGSSMGQIQVLTTARGYTTFRASDFDNNGTSDLPTPLDSLYDPIFVGNNSGTGVDIQLNLSSLTVGSPYRLQLYMASSNQTDRTFDILHNGSTLLATYDNSTPHGEIIDLSWIADQATEQFILRGNGDGFNVPSLNGFSLASPPVPEPSSFLLLGLGAIGLLRYSRRRSRRLCRKA